MKRFLLYLFIFSLPILLFLVSVELLVHTIPNSYSYKYNYIKKNGGNVEVLSLGHSQLYDGFMPEAFSLQAFNLSNSAQSYREDYYLLKDLLPYSPNVKYVILPIGYMNVVKTNKNKGSDGFTERSTFYYEYMNLNYDNQIPIKYRFECFNPQRASGKVISYYIHHIDIVGCDSLGRRNTHGVKEHGYILGKNSVLNDYTIDTKIKSEMKVDVGQYLEKIARLLASKHIKLILVSPPHYWLGFTNINSEQIEFIQDYIKTLQSKYHLRYINLESDSRFNEVDFYNETHLSDIGAEKFTEILNDSIFAN